MRPPIEELQTYYASPRGQRLASLIGAALSPALANRTQDRVLGLGYANPYLGGVIQNVERVILAHPQLQGYSAWPPNQPNCVVQVDEYNLPFADALFDQVVVVHALEFADPARRLLREIWRVTAPRGRLILVVPNRLSLLSLFDSSPFGNGRPYSIRQVQALLGEAMFTVDAIRGIAAGLGGPATDRAILRLLPAIAGLHVVIATKSDIRVMTGGGKPARTLARNARPVRSVAQSLILK
jgi:SAM-dependent methyltransferase